MIDNLNDENFKKDYIEGISQYFDSLAKLAKNQLDSGLILQEMINSQIKNLTLISLPKYSKHIESMQRLAFKLISESKHNFDMCYSIEIILERIDKEQTGEQLELPLES